MKDFTDFMYPLLEKRRLRKYPKGQIILYEGDKSPYIYFLKSGAIKLYGIDDDGNEKIIIIVGPGDVFPLLYALGADKSVTHFYSTIADSELYTVDKPVFLKNIDSDAQFASACLRWFAYEVQYLAQRMSSLEKTDTATKLKFALEYLLARHSTPTKSGWYTVNFPTTQQLLADMVGITRESANSALKDLQENNVIGFLNRHYLKINKLRLKKI